MNNSIILSPLLNGDRVIRYSGETVINKESLYDHVGKMTAIAILLSNIIEFDLKEVLYRIAIHDLEESVSQDVVRKIKHYDSEIKNKIDEISYKILSKSVSDSILNDVRKAKDHSTFEGALVHFLDVYQAYQYLAFEVHQLGNKSLLGTLELDCCPYLIDVYNKIRSEYPQIERLKEYIPSL